MNRTTDWAPTPYRTGRALSRLAEAGPTLLSDNTISETFRLTGAPIDGSRLDAAVVAAIERHPALRTKLRVHPRNGPQQAIVGPPDTILRVIDTGPLAERQFDGKVGAVHAAEARAAIDLAAGTSIRAVLVTDGSSQHALIVTVDHTMCDGVSLATVVRDIGAAYADPEASERAPSYSLIEYERAEAAALSDSDSAWLRAAWRERLGGGIPQMIVGRPGGWKTFGNEGAQVNAELEREEYLAFRRLAAELQVTPFVLAAAAILDTLRGSLLNDGLSFIAPMAGRVPGTPASLVGNLVNLIPVLVERPDSGAFEALVSAVRDGVVWAMDHQALPFAEIAAEVDPDGPSAPQDRRQIFLSGMPTTVLELPGLRVRPPRARPRSRVKAQFDLSVWITDDNTTLRIESVYRTALFEQGHVEKLLRSVRAVALDAGSRSGGDRPASTADSADLEPAARRLKEIWCELLGVQGVSHDADFYGLGGDSLLAVRLIAQVHDLLGVRLQLGDVLSHPRFGDLTAIVEARFRQSTT